MNGSVFPTGQTFTDLTGGGYHSVALRPDGSVVGRGWNDYGQTVAPPEAGRDPLVAVSAGTWHSLALRRDGSILAWGRNHLGQTDVPAGNHSTVAISGGDDFSLALRSDGSLFGWGSNRFGRTDVPSGNDFTAIAAGGNHGLALHRNGSIVAWGEDRLGQTKVPAGDDFVAVAAGRSHGLALRISGSIVAWGTGEQGQLDVPEGAGFKAIAAGYFHGLAVRRDGSLIGWCRNKYGENDVPAGHDFVAIAAGGWHSLAMRQDGSIVQWGHIPRAVEVTLPPWQSPPAPTAVQALYRNGVPHTDRQGRLMTQYEPARSFFPIGIYGPDGDLDGKSLKEGSFNTIQAWTIPTEAVLRQAEEFDLQLLWKACGGLDHWQALAEQIKPHRSRLLANYAIDEPYQFTTGSGFTWKDPMDMIQSGWHKTFRENKQAVHAFFPDLPVFVNMSPIVDAAQHGWGEWIATSDIASLDNYPFKNGGSGRSELSSPTSGIPRTLWAAATVDNQSKPVWLIVPGFEQPIPQADAYFRFPTPAELRAVVYAGLIHGATGIIYFVSDGQLSRKAQCIGLAKAPQAEYPRQKNDKKHSVIASPVKRIQSRALWATAAQINAELKELTPVILSPTIGPDVPYSVHIAKGEPFTAADIRAMLKPHPEGGYVLITVNIDNAVLSAETRFEQPLKSVQPLFENRPPLELEEGQASFLDHYEPFDTHVFRIELKSDP